jgi:hypothetical protein
VHEEEEEEKEGEREYPDVPGTVAFVLENRGAQS